jgi:hypothetical protein
VYAANVVQNCNFHSGTIIQKTAVPGESLGKGPGLFEATGSSNSRSSITSTCQSSICYFTRPPNRTTLQSPSTNKRHLQKCLPGLSLLSDPPTVATFAAFAILIRPLELVVAWLAPAPATAQAAHAGLVE